MAGGLAGPFCWLLGAGSCSWPVMTPKPPLPGSLGPGGTPLGEDRHDGLTLVILNLFISSLMSLNSEAKNFKKTQNQKNCSDKV